MDNTSTIVIQAKPGSLLRANMVSFIKLATVGIKGFIQFLNRSFGRHYIIKNESLLDRLINANSSSYKAIKIEISPQLAIGVVFNALGDITGKFNIHVEFKTLNDFNPEVYLLLTNKSTKQLRISFKNGRGFFKRKFKIAADKIDRQLAYLNFNNLKNGVFASDKLAVLIPVDGSVIYLNPGRSDDFVPVYYNDMVVVFYNKRSMHKRYNSMLRSLPFISSDLLLEYRHQVVLKD